MKLADTCGHRGMGRNRLAHPLKKEDIRLVTYVPDKVLKPLIDR